MLCRAQSLCRPSWGRLADPHQRFPPTFSRIFLRAASSQSPTTKKRSLPPSPYKDATPPPTRTSRESVQPSFSPPARPPPPIISKPNNTLLNPPHSTYPPPLGLPTWDDSLPLWKSYYRLGKAYLSFYRTGFRQILQNYRLARSLPPSSPRTKPPSPYSSRRVFQSALKKGDITRAQYHLLLRVRSDISRLPIFGLVFLCCGEFTPLLVPFLSGVVPKTLWLPGQVEKARRKQRERVEGKQEREKEEKEKGKGRFGLLGQSRIYSEDVKEGEGKERLVRVGMRINAWPRLWDPIAKKVFSAGLLGRRVNAAVEGLKLDDWAIERDGGVSGLREEEVRLAVEERGVDVEGRGEAELRMMLQQCVDENRRFWSEEMKTWLRIERIGANL